MGGEFDRQNKQIDRINDKVVVDVVHLDQANRRINRL
jgi:hypothetical protein